MTRDRIPRDGTRDREQPSRVPCTSGLGVVGFGSRKHINTLFNNAILIRPERVSEASCTRTTMYFTVEHVSKREVSILFHIRLSVRTENFKNKQ